MNRVYRIAVGTIFTESNHLGGRPTDLGSFERGELRRGHAVLDCASSYVGGMLEVLRGRNAEVAPLLVATACPGGPLTSACYHELKTELLRRLRESLPVDGVLLPLHGAAAADGVDDLEGDLLAAVRRVVGLSAPVVATLDLHAHVTETMMQNADALVAIETYPHRDTFETGHRGARMLLNILDGKCQPTMALAKVPVLVSGVHGHTEGEGPFADVLRLAKSHEGKNGVLSVSVFLVHPYLDVPDMGGGCLVITDNDPQTAAALAREMALHYWQRRFDLDPPVFTPADAIVQGLKIPGGAILLVETADCCGGGAAGDSVHSLKALLETRVNELSLVPVVDAEAAALCHQAGVGNEVNLALGHHLDPQWGNPVAVTGKVGRLGDGCFRYRGGTWNGVEANMGASAVLEIGAVQVLITTHATYDWRDEQFAAMNMDTRRAKFIVVKNPMNYRLAYADVVKKAFILDTPGPTPPNLHHVQYRRMSRPFYPADKEIPDSRLTLLTRPTDRPRP